MSFCGNCGAKVEESFITCPECGKILREDLYEQQKTGKSNQSSQLQVSDKMDITLADGEIEIKSYFLTKVFLSGIKGFLHITNKRIVFNADSKDSKVYMSTPIETVGSINAFIGRSLNIKGIIIAIACILLGVMFLGVSSSLGRYASTGGITFIAVFLMAIGIVVIYYSTRKALYLSISSINSSPGLVVGKGNTTGLSFYTIEGVSGPDALQVMNEIGAMVLDLQQLGDLAIKKWQD